MLECLNLVTGYPGRQVSQEINFTVRSGEIFTLIGPNGSGKTTLLKTMAGLLPPLGGTIRLNGHDLSQFSPRELARCRAYLPQGREVPELTAEALIRHGRFPHQGFSRKMSEHDNECVCHAMTLTGTTDFRNRSMRTLSGGQRQQVYLAMTIAQDTPLLFWDEMTAYLDVKNRLEMLELAQNLRDEGRTVIMILHELDDAMRCSDRICLLDGNGLVRRVAAPDDMFLSGDINRVFDIRCDRVAGCSGGYIYTFGKKNDEDKQKEETENAANKCRGKEETQGARNYSQS